MCNKILQLVSDIGEVSMEVLVESFDDAASYTCKGVNQAGEISKTFNIDVLGKNGIIYGCRVFD